MLFVAALLLGDASGFAPSVNSISGLSRVARSTRSDESSSAHGMTGMTATRLTSHMPVLDEVYTAPEAEDEAEDAISDLGSGWWQESSPTGAGVAESIWGRPTLKPYEARGMSQSLPFAPLPAVSRLGAPGDAGFDPLGLSDTPEKFFWYREAEVKHSRLAMLAAVGWPASELFHDPVARFIEHTFPNVPDILDHTIDRTAPALLNHGLSFVPSTFWVGAVLTTAALEYRGWIVKQAGLMSEDGYVIGEFGFDPLNLWTLAASDSVSSESKEAAEAQEQRARDAMSTAELKNGRLAMIAVLGYVVQEAVTRVPIVAQTPYLFKPALLSIANLLTH